MNADFGALILALVTEPEPDEAARRRQERARRWSRFWLAFAVVCVVALLLGMIDGAAKAQRSPVHFEGAWQPDRQIYHPGDLIRFRSEQVITEPETLLLFFERFRNVDTDEAYPQAIFGQGSGRAERSTRRPVRHLPDRMTPGTYVLEGWTLPQGPRRALPARYVSETFAVKPR